MYALIVLAPVRIDYVLYGSELWASRGGQTVYELAFRAVYMGLCLLALLLGMIARPRITPLHLAFAAMIGWCLFIGWHCQTELAQMKQIASFATWVAFLLAGLHVLSWQHWRQVRTALWLAVGVNVFAGILQHYVGGGPMLGEVLGGLRVHSGGGGVLINGFLPHLLALMFFTQCMESWSAPRLLLGGGLFLLGCAPVLRGGMVAFAVALSVLFVLARRNRWRMGFLWVLMGVMSAGVFGEILLEKMVAYNAQTVVNTSGRLEHWPALFAMAMERPVTGFGPNADITEYCAYTDLSAAHNDYLSMGVNYGIPGVLLAWVPMFGILVYLLKRRAVSGDRTVILSGVGAMVLLLVLSFTDNTIRTPGAMVLLLSPVIPALALAEAAGLRASDRSGGERPGTHLRVDTPAIPSS